MQISEYIRDPCGSSSLPFWKAEQMPVPDHVRIVRDDQFSAVPMCAEDKLYFKLMHDLKSVAKPVLPDGYQVIQCGTEAFARHISLCYTWEHISPEELDSYRIRPVYRPELWLAVADTESGQIAASGIAELDTRIGEGILEWIQVSPECRRKGLDSFVVNELLNRLRNHAAFVTVSGRMDNESHPFQLYRSCGFGNPVIWHVIRTTGQQKGDRS